MTGRMRKRCSERRKRCSERRTRCSERKEKEEHSIHWLPTNGILIEVCRADATSRFLSPSECIHLQMHTTGNPRMQPSEISETNGTL